MANRNQYTYTPGYAGSGKGYVPPGNRNPKPKPREAQTPVTRQAPPRARREVAPPPPRPMKDLLMFCMVLFVVPLIGIIGIFAKPVLWAFVIVSAVCVLLIFLLRCFTTGTRVVIGVALLLFSVLGLVAAIDPAPGQQQSFASLDNPAVVNTQTMFPEATATIPGMFPGYVPPEASPTPPLGASDDAGDGLNQGGDGTQIFPGLQTQTQTEAPPDGTQTGLMGIAGMSDAAPVNQVISEAQQALENYLTAWTTHDFEEMAKYSLPSWRSAQDSPTMTLYWIYSYWTLNNWTITPETTSPSADSAMFSVICDLTPTGKSTTVKQRYDALVFMDGSGGWYVDPASMRSGTEVVETLPPSLVEAAQPTPEPEPTIDPNMTLWYNDDGGSYYHAEEKCKDISPANYKYMKSFTYGELGDNAYKDFKTCQTCGAPPRP